LIDD